MYFGEGKGPSQSFQLIAPKCKDNTFKDNEKTEKGAARYGRVDDKEQLMI